MSVHENPHCSCPISNWRSEVADLLLEQPYCKGRLSVSGSGCVRPCTWDAMSPHSNELYSLYSVIKITSLRRSRKVQHQVTTRQDKHVIPDNSANIVESQPESLFRSSQAASFCKKLFLCELLCGVCSFCFVLVFGFFCIPMIKSI